MYTISGIDLAGCFGLLLVFLFIFSAFAPTRWRLATKDPEAGAEAQALMETLLTRSWKPRDALLRARAAIAADRPTAAWGSLSRIPDMLQPPPRKLVESALELAEALPEDLAEGLRVRLRARRPRRALP